MLAVFKYLLAVPILIFVLVYLPRTLMYIIVKCTDGGSQWKLIAYRLRISSAIIQILLAISVMIVCRSVLTVGSAFPFSITMTGYLFSIIYFAIFEIYFCVIYKRNCNEGREEQKERQLNDSQRDRRALNSGIQIQAQYQMPNVSTGIMGPNLEQQRLDVSPYGLQLNQSAQNSQPNYMANILPQLDKQNLYSVQFPDNLNYQQHQ
eukprot:403331405